jgi:hypothetical protein
LEFFLDTEYPACGSKFYQNFVIFKDGCPEEWIMYSCVDVLLWDKLRDALEGTCWHDLYVLDFVEGSSLVLIENHL